MSEINFPRKRVVLDDSSSSSDDSFTERRPRKKRLAMIMDESSSDSDSSMEKPRKKCLRVVSESSDSSGSEIVVRKTKSKQIASDSKDTSEGDSDCNLDSQPTCSKALKSAGSSSSSGDDQSETCPICLVKFKSQEVGTPESCDHSFCVDCIQEWAKSVNTCPVDRKKFNIIVVRSSYSGEFSRKIRVNDSYQNIAFNMEPNEMEVDDCHCEICGLSNNEDSLLLCDRCDLAFHLECLDPPLSNVPSGEWFCTMCSVPGHVQYNVSVNLIDEFLFTRRNRLIPRTRQTERIRTNIVTRRQWRNVNSVDNNASSNDSDFTETQQAISNTHRRTRKKCKTARRKRQRTYKKYKIVYEINQTTGERVAVKKKKRKAPKRNKKQTSTKDAINNSTKRRLANQLRIQPQKTAGQSLPDVKVRGNESDITIQRARAGIPALHMFGPRDELDYFSGSDEGYEEAGSSVSIRVARRPNVSDAALARRISRKRNVMMGPETSVSTSVDVLGSILESQTQLHSKNSVLSVGNGGIVQAHADKRRFDLLKENGANRVRQAPMYSNNSTRVNPDERPNTSSYNNSDNYYQYYQSNQPTSTVSSSQYNENNSTPDNRDDNNVQDYSTTTRCNSSDKDKANKKNGENDRNTPITNSDSELDIYSDIETVTTSKFEENETKCPTPPVILSNFSHTQDDDNNESDTDMVIDTEKPESDKYDPAAVFDSEEDECKKDDTVTSTSESLNISNETDGNLMMESEEQFEIIQSSNDTVKMSLLDDNDEEPEDGCPNFNIYSSESINLAKNTDLNPFASISTTLLNIIEDNQKEILTENDSCSSPAPEVVSIERNPSPTFVTENEEAAPVVQPTKAVSPKGQSTLYSDSEDESFMKLTAEKPFGISDIKSMTEDISEEERSYTPCLDEREQTAMQEGLEGLDTEMISDDDKNDFEELDDQANQQNIQDVDALEINAKEGEFDFSRPDEGDETTHKSPENDSETVDNGQSPLRLQPILTAESKFKKLSQNNKGRNYRDKDRARSNSIDNFREIKRDGKKRRRQRNEVALYDVRSLIEAKPKRDRFGRDPSNRLRSTSPRKSSTPVRSFQRDGGRRSSSLKSPTPPLRLGKDDHRLRSPTLSSRSRTPPLRPSPSRIHKSQSPVLKRKKQKSPSLSKSRRRKRSRSRSRKRQPSVDKNRNRMTAKTKSKGTRSERKRERSQSPVLYRRASLWERKRSRGWSPSLSPSASPEGRNMTPPWTPPQNMESSSVRTQKLTITLPNTTRTKKKKEKHKKEKRPRDSSKRRKRDRLPRANKEVFTSGNNILVSVSFNKENQEKSKKVRSTTEQPVTRRVIRENEPSPPKQKRQKTKTVTNAKPIAIIDLERSPFRVITPPNEVIELSDSDGAENSAAKDTHTEATPQAASPEQETTNGYLNTSGPKTPPEPQVKFTFNSKQTQLRTISNPLLEADEPEEDIDPQEELENRLNEVMHKGPNTPPEPPSSPLSSPDAYDPFEPTKSRSQTPVQSHQTNLSKNTAVEDSHEEINESITIDSDKFASPQPASSHTPPLTSANVQPADSQSATTPVASNAASPERTIAVVINQVVQSPIVSKPVPPTFSSSLPATVTSTPVATNSGASRINILNSTVLSHIGTVPSVHRIVLPKVKKSSPVNKVSPSKSTVKLTPIKPMPSKNAIKTSSLPAVKGVVRKQQKAKSDELLDFDSPYSPGSNDFDDLFEPPSAIAKAIQAKKAPAKQQSAFDSLFGSSPATHSKGKSKKKTAKKPQRNTKNTKTVGVKLDEDNLKILEDLPNSAVELQVKDKFLKKLNRQERVVEEVKFVLKPYYNKKKVNKEEYKEVLRRAVPKICHNKTGEINPKKIQRLVVAYVKNLKRNKKVTSSSSVQQTQNQQVQNTHPQKTEAVSNWLSKLN